MTLTAKISALQTDYDGNCTLALTCENRDEARRIFGEMRDVKITADIKPWKKKRSIDANAYYWVLAGKIANAAGIGRDEVYRAHIRDVGDNHETICIREAGADKLIEGWQRNGIGWVADKLPSKLSGCVNVLLYYGSSTYNTVQMSRLIDNAVEDARSLGIETATPRELAMIKEDWG